MSMEFLRRTCQVWKLYAGVAGVVLGGTIVFLQAHLAHWMGAGSVFGVVLIACAAGCASFGFLMGAVRCPACHAAIVWRIASSRGAVDWLYDLLDLQECPVCQYNPRLPGNPKG